MQASPLDLAQVLKEEGLSYRRRISDYVVSFFGVGKTLSDRRTRRGGKDSVGLGPCACRKKKTNQVTVL